MVNLQRVSARLAQEYGLDAPAMSRYAGLVSEVGELGKGILLNSEYGKRELRATKDIMHEIGDVLFSIGLLANELKLKKEAVHMKKFQHDASNFARKYGLDAPVMARYVDLVSEVGELGKELLLGSGYGKEELKITDDTAKEMGDVVFSLTMLANELDLDLEECFVVAMEKYKERFEQTGQIGS